MKKENIFLITFGSILILIPFFINIYSILRLISVLIGIILLLIGLIINTENKIPKIIIYPIVLILGIYSIDFITAKIFKKVPIIAYEVVSSKKAIVYNAPFYRMFNCDGIKTLDPKYKKEFVCKDDSIKILSINTILTNPKETFKENNGKYLHLSGKITKIIGNSEIELNGYIEGKSLNGYVEFNKEKVVVLKNLDINPSDYHIYDNIEVIGMLTGFETKDDINYLKLTDVKILESDLYKSYELVVNNINTHDLVKKDDAIYYAGIEGIYYKYDEDNIYTIDYLIKDERVILEDLIKDITPEEINEKHKLYKLNDYNLMICQNESIIFINKNIKKIDKLCEMGN